MLLVRRPSSTSSNLVRTSPLSQPLVSMLKLCNTRTLALPSGMSGVRTSWNIEHTLIHSQRNVIFWLTFPILMDYRTEAVTILRK
ncbi:hypothetical protein YC2023_038882 [Brassica napus]